MDEKVVEKKRKTFEVSIVNINTTPPICLSQIKN